MLMDAFDDAGKYITSTVVIMQFDERRLSSLYIKVFSKKGKHSGFWTSVTELLDKQEELGFRILNRSGQCLSFLGDNT